jgi:serine/threonine protein kinase
LDLGVRIDLSITSPGEMSEGLTAPAHLAASSELIAPGTRIGKYKVVHRIAFGGMAEIYLARAGGLHGFEKYVVLKCILPQHAANEDFIRMFLKEARLAATLDHANIAHVYEIGETRGNYFFTMEYLHGEDLRWIMRALGPRGLRLPLEHAIEIVIGAASGLNFAHDKRGPDGRPLGIVHRDVSPANLVVTYDGGVKVVDFGIAKMTADPELSRRGSLKGKLAYMSPEQLNNLPMDRRGDVFALGVVLYEITTHARLFKGATEVETMRAVMDGTVTPPSTVVPDYPPALERIVLRALEREPDKRYQSAREMQLDLEAFASDERLRVSSAALAEWMERTFGPKQELWHSLPDVATGSGSSTPDSAREPTAPTSPVVRADVAAPAASGIDMSVPIDLSGAAPRPRRARAGALAAIALAAAAGALWLGRGHLGNLALSASGPREPVVLVAEQGSVAVERGGPTAAPLAPEVAPLQAPSPPPPASRTAPAAPAAGQAPPMRSASRRSHAATPSGAAPGESFSATFARREGDIRRCFLGHTDTASGAAAEISLRFDVGRDGRVTSLSVLPPAVGAAPLGACLTKVGKTTVFSPQAAPLTFRIPLTVQLQADAAGGR